MNRSSEFGICNLLGSFQCHWRCRKERPGPPFGACLRWCASWPPWWWTALSPIRRGLGYSWAFASASRSTGDWWTAIFGRVGWVALEGSVGGTSGCSGRAWGMHGSVASNDRCCSTLLWFVRKSSRKVGKPLIVPATIVHIIINTSFSLLSFSSTYVIQNRSADADIFPPIHCGLL